MPRGRGERRLKFFYELSALVDFCRSSYFIFIAFQSHTNNHTFNHHNRDTLMHEIIVSSKHARFSEEQASRPKTIEKHFPHYSKKGNENTNQNEQRLNNQPPPLLLPLFRYWNWKTLYIYEKWCRCILHARIHILSEIEVWKCRIKQWKFSEEEQITSLINTNRKRIDRL